MDIKQYLMLGKQGTTFGGAAPGSYTAIPCDFDHPAIEQGVNIPKEYRNTRDAAFMMVAGNQRASWGAEGEPYADTFPFWLLSLLGQPTTSTPQTGVYVHTFTPQDATNFLGMKWSNSVQAFEMLNTTVDKLDLSYGGDEQLMYSVEGQGSPFSTNAGGTPTYTTLRPLKHWMATATWSGGYSSKLISASLTYEQPREAVFYATGSTRAPGDFVAGERGGSFSAVVRYDSNALYANTIDTSVAHAITLSFVDTGTVLASGHFPTLTVTLPQVRFSKAKINTKGKYPTLEVEAEALMLDATAGYAIQLQIKNNVASY